MANDQEAVLDDWAGDRGDRWCRNVDVMEEMVRPVGEALLAAAAFQPGERVLEIGSGGGWTSRKAADAVGPTGLVVGLDISPALVAEAGRRGADRPQLRFQCGDASTVVPEGAPFDRLFSRFGVMFFADPKAAFRHLAGLLRAGGRMDIAVWADPRLNPWMMEMRRVVSAHVELPKQDRLAPGPFQLADTDYLDAVLAEAGFVDVRRQMLTTRMLQGGQDATPEAACDFVLGSLAIGDVLSAAPQAAQRAARADLVDLYRRHLTPDGVMMEGAVWLVEARVR